METLQPEKMKTEPPETEVKSMSDDALSQERYFHLLFLALIWGILTLIPIAWSAHARSTSAMITGFVLIQMMTGSAVCAVAIWSALGAGSYLVRLFWSHCIGAIVGLFVLLGSVAHDSHQPRLEVVLLISSVLPLISLAMQLVFIAGRFVAGWQLVYQNDQPNTAFDLRDLFTLMFVVAIALTAPQVAVAMDRMEGGPHVSELLTVTAVLTLSAIVCALIALPVLLFAFRAKNETSGMAYTCIYAIGISFLIAIGLAVIKAPLELVLAFAGVAFGFIASLAIVFIISRGCGFRLASYRDRKQTAAKIPDPRTDTPKPSVEVHPLDAD